MLYTNGTIISKRYDQESFTGHDPGKINHNRADNYVQVIILHFLLKGLSFDVSTLHSVSSLL